MDGMEEKLNSILSNPQMMAQIMSMAQSFGASQPQQEKPQTPPTEAPTFDPALLQQVVGMAQQTGVDRNQQGLLQALSPYLSNERIIRLEKAMRAAKIAGLASSFFAANGSIFSGR